MKKILLFLVVPSSLLSMDKPTVSIRKRSQRYEARIAFQLALAADMIENPDAPSLEEMREAIEVFSSDCTPHVLGVRVFRPPTPPIEDRIFKTPPRDVEVETESIEPLPFLFAPFPDGSSDKKPPLDIRKASAEIPRDPEWKNKVSFEHYSFEIQCPQCTYQRITHTSSGLDSKRAYTNIVDCFRKHVKKYHPKWKNKKNKEYIKANIIKRRYP